MISILVTGAKGQLGSELVRASEDDPGMAFHFTDIEELDICNVAAVREFLGAHPVQYLVNCAAYTAVDQAEDDAEAAMMLNANAVEVLACESLRRKIQLIHISTDYVFNGEGNRPYRTDDPVDPQTVYGQSKLAGETAVRKAGTGIIIRTSWLYSVFGHNFVKTILRLGREKESLQVVFDQTGSPTNGGDLARTILDMIRHDREQDRKPRYEVYHYSNRGVCSWFEFARAIVGMAGSPCRVEPVESKDYKTRAARPRYSVLDKTKLTADYPITIPHWKQSLEACIKELTDL